MTDKRESRLSALIDEEPDLELALALKEDPELAAMAETVRQIRAARAFEPASPGFAERGWQRVLEETGTIVQPPAADMQDRTVVRAARSNRNAFRNRKGWWTAAASMLLVAALLSSPWWRGQQASASEIEVTGTGVVADLGQDNALSPQYVGGTDRVSYGQEDRVILWNRASHQSSPFPLEFAYMRDMSWSPDGTIGAFVGYESAKQGPVSPGLWVVGQDGSNLRQIAKPADPDTAYEEPVWSPDGTRIAFTSEHASLSDETGVIYDRKIYVVDADGSHLTELTAGRQPTWSRDGTQLAYSTEREPGKSEIWVMDASGGNARKLADGSDPAWSPKGPFVAFAKDIAEHRTLRKDADGKETFGADATYRELWAVNAESGAETRLTEGRFPEELVEGMLKESDSRGEAAARYVISGMTSDEQPTWSPDGSRILFTRSSVEEKGPHFTLQELQIAYR
ncbi:hypothetical protein [Cohnella caldifontis]|uniref:hypothetical protein n=1 Tax=Cohnella caldifontis TaxID=3027471 RepID=UPI0023EE0838|nr:hypothetical protein [Cohnella sp. YIM B05605]